ncbi:PfkB family carbohydrate kinase, partial [Geminicoccus harenae]
ALLEPGRRPIRVPTDAVVPADRTGAGDCFVGTYLAAWLSGRPAADAARLAVLAASRSVLVPGAQEYRPVADELADALAKEGV